MPRPILNKARVGERLSNAGRKPFDVVLMLKILILPTLYYLNIEQELFDLFHAELESYGFEVKSGLIVDSSFVEVPKQHNSRGDNV